MILNVVHIGYGKPTPNNKIVNKSAFSAASNVAMPIEYHFFCWEEYYVIVLVTLTAYTIENIVNKAVIAFQSTSLFSQAVHE